jgi:hypothetical protein
MTKPILTYLFLVTLTYLLSALHAESFNIITASSTVKWWFTLGVIVSLAPMVFMIELPKPCCNNEDTEGHSSD